MKLEELLFSSICKDQNSSEAAEASSAGEITGDCCHLFELEGMPYYSTFVKLELIGQVLVFKCNVKEIQTEYHYS